MTAAELVRAAHQNGYRGDAMIRRWARAVNTDRDTPTVTAHTVTLAVALESEITRADTLGYRRLAAALRGWVGE